MHTEIKKLLETKTYINSKNETVEIHSETGLQQCEFIQKIIRDNNFKQSIEIGCAYGISSAAILEEISKNDGLHIIIDRFQTEHWGSNGVDLLEKLKFKGSYVFYEEFSYMILPKILNSGIELDFAYIDSTKLLDYLMTDFFFIDKMLKKNGVIVFDDNDFVSIRKLIRYISQLPHYEVYDTYPKNLTYSKSKSLKINLLKKLPYSEAYVKNKWLNTDSDLGINTSCVALIKKDNDNRKYNWHKSF